METDKKKIEFILDYIFQDIKDKFEINTTSHLRFYLNNMNIVLSNDEIRKLYIKLTNYRIEKYGNSVIFKDFPKEKKYIVYDNYINLKKK